MIDYQAPIKPFYGLNQYYYKLISLIIFNYFTKNLRYFLSKIEVSTSYF